MAYLVKRRAQRAAEEGDVLTYPRWKRGKCRMGPEKREEMLTGEMDAIHAKNNERIRRQAEESDAKRRTRKELGAEMQGALREQLRLLRERGSAGISTDEMYTVAMAIAATTDALIRVNSELESWETWTWY